MSMKCWPNILLCSFLIALVACTEEMVIDVEKGDPMIGVEASFTDELKHHEAIMSYTTEFYGNESAQMVSGATVFVTDGVDTLYYIESAEQPGHYFTDLVAGRRNVLYRFCAEVPDASEPDGILRLSAQSKMCDNVSQVDSLVVKPYNGVDDTVPSVVFGDTIEWLYPYFQSLDDKSIVYMPMIYRNDTLLTDTLTKRMAIPMAGYAGFYVNGYEMQLANKEIPIHLFMRSKLQVGDRIRADLYSIPFDYLYYIYTIAASIGSNPMMGAPANVMTNLNPSDRAVGWFLTASVVSKETVFKP